MDLLPILLRRSGRPHYRQQLPNQVSCNAGAWGADEVGTALGMDTKPLPAVFSLLQ